MVSHLLECAEIFELLHYRDVSKFCLYKFLCFCDVMDINSVYIYGYILNFNKEAADE